MNAVYNIKHITYKGLLVLRHLSLGSVGPVQTPLHSNSCAEPN